VCHAEKKTVHIEKFDKREIADPHCTHCQASRADTQTKACQRVQFFPTRG